MRGREIVPAAGVSHKATGAARCDCSGIEAPLRGQQTVFIHLTQANGAAAGIKHADLAWRPFTVTQALPHVETVGMDLFQLDARKM